MMIKKPNKHYESLQMKVLRLDEDDLIRTSVESSGDNYYGWDWNSGAPSGSDVFS